MKKTRFEIDIFRHGEHNSAIIAMITNHNEGKIELTFRVIKGYMEAKYCQYPSIMPNVKTREDIAARTLDIIENEKPTISIKIVTVPECIISIPEHDNEHEN